MPTRSQSIFLSAGEASGDHYGAQIIDALKPSLPNATFTGLGGKDMEAAGQQRVIRAEDVAVMGITEILRHIPRIYASYRRLVRSIKQNRPDVAILIDFPDVNFRLAKHLHRLGVPVLWFVSPQLWAWKRRRLRWVQQRVSQMFVIFPFEEPFYRNRGVDATFVGHPLADLPLPTISREDYAAQFSLDPARPWVALLPGSRGGEISANLPEMLEATKLLGSTYDFLIPVAETVSPHRLASMQQEVATRVPGSHPPRITFVRDARAALFHSRAAVVASGTATVQAALIGTPFLVVYRVSDLTFRLAKKLVRYPAEIGAEPDNQGNLPIAMPNLIAGHRIVPELINSQFTANNITQILKELLQENSPRRNQQLHDLKTVRQSLTLASGSTAITTIRDAVLKHLQAAS